MKSRLQTKMIGRVIRLGCLAVMLFGLGISTSTARAEQQITPNAALAELNAPRATGTTAVQWLQQAQLNGAFANSVFGAAVAMSADGNIIAIGAQMETVNSHAAQGAAYVYVRSGNTWSQLHLVSSDGVAGDHFGAAVSISNDGNSIVIGAPRANSTHGVAYLFERSGAVWIQTQKFWDSSAPAANAFVGAAVAISGNGNTVIIGAYGSNASQGKVLSYWRSGSSWTTASGSSMYASDGAANDTFGVAVALNYDGSTAIIGATGKSLNRGAAYVFKYTYGFFQWSQQSEILAWDGVAADDFGRSVALSSDGNIALVGSDNATVNTHLWQGAAYTFTRSGTTWSNGLKLTSSDGASGDWFGNSVALTSDGRMALIGATHATLYGRSAQGAAYIFNGSNFSRQQKLTSDGSASDTFGTAVAMSSDGVMMVIGAQYYGSAGAAYVFQQSPMPWSLQDARVAADGASNDYFGRGVALSQDGSTALVGAVSKNAVYVYTRSNGVWSQQTKISSPDGSIDFGNAVALSRDGDTALIGAPAATVTGYINQGAAYVVTRGTFGWGTPIKLVASDSAANDRFGFRVALSGDGLTAVMGAPGKATNRGAVYVATRGRTGWNTPVKLLASDGVSGDQFGMSLAVNDTGSILLAGAPFGSNGSIKTGAMYEFVRSSGVYSQQPKITPADGILNGAFGSAVSLNGDGTTALITGSINPQPGAGYVYIQSGGGWSLQTELVPFDSNLGDGFGTSAALSSDGNTAVIGAASIDVSGNMSQGGIYAFARNGTTWSLQGKLLAPDGAEGDSAGQSIALSADGRTVLFGAPQHNNFRGEAYIFINSNYMLFLPMIMR